MKTVLTILASKTNEEYPVYNFEGGEDGITSAKRVVGPGYDNVLIKIEHYHSLCLYVGDVIMYACQNYKVTYMYLCSTLEQEDYDSSREKEE